MASNTDVDMDSSSIEFTLTDTYEHLKEVKHEKEQEIKKLINIVKNNQVQTLGPNVTSEQIRQKRLKFVQSVQKFITEKQPKDLPIPLTNDFYANAVQEIDAEVSAIGELHKNTDEEINEIISDINYMEKKLAAFKEMKEALAAEENETNSNYEAEMMIAKKIFQEVKKDLQVTVDLLFPENLGFQEILCILTRALNKGGDDLYISVETKYLDFINFLEYADIVQFHPNDNRKVKLREF
ncbi:uncharacterized protein LOC106641662 [Copidosoma floridanum]|uniref:uncharacterized protein LOC106641662 n=1 Tax=Copidosoma floridanum TaxID=29053 RepID=UPI0006C9805D|nr:uncharacterized protein LOC106641662 [Copidosoma floridanum]